MGGGKVGSLLRAGDWSQTALGPRAQWPVLLRTALGLIVESDFPMALLWGPEALLLYNDACSVIAADKHLDALGRPACEVWPEVWAVAEPLFEAVMTRGEPSCIEDMRFLLDRHGRREDAYFTVCFSPLRLDDGSVAGSLVTLQETTVAREHDRRLRKSEELFRTLFESIDEGFCIVEVLFDGEQPVDYRYIEVNPVFEQQTGLTNAVGQRMRELAPDHEAYWFEIFGQVAQTGEPVRFQREASVFGRYYDVYAFRVGAPEQRQVGILFRDITERRRAEKALREAEEKLRAAVANAAIGFTIMKPDCRIVDANPAFCRLTGYTVDELQTKRFSELIHPEDLETCQAQLERMMAGETTDFTIENRTIRRDGTPVWVRKSISLVRDATGEPRWIIALCEDTTDRKLAQELLHANKLLEEANQEKAEFLALLSHELRNPLSPIMYALELLEQAAPGSKQAKHAQEVIGRQAKQLARLVDDLLEVTRLSRGRIQLHPRHLDLNELVRRTVEDHRALFEQAGLDLEITLSPTPLFVEADDNRLAQVVGNLLHNAVKFTPRGGQVRVCVTADPAARQAILRVADTGEGIDAAVLPQVFEPFTQADRTLDRSRGGLGLGLALVKGMVELHGGAVEARSNGIGRGAELLVRLPLATPPVIEGNGETPYPGPKRRVLIIEDNVDAADNLREILSLAGHSVTVAHDGPGGIAMARSFRPEVVLCDIGLPGMSGYEVARELRADPELADTYLVALTGYAHPEDLERAAKAGFDLHLAKPADLAQLNEVLRELRAPSPRQTAGD